MQMHIRLEGTAPEIGEVLQTLSHLAELHTTAIELSAESDATGANAGSTDTEAAFVTTRFARRTLTRRQLSAPMRKVLKALYEAHPGWLSLPEMHFVASYTPAQFAGLMGAFGRRMANTEGYDPEAHFFQFRWNEAENTWDYRLPDSVREALVQEQFV